MSNEQIKTVFLKCNQAEGRNPCYYNSGGYWTPINHLNSQDIYPDLEKLLEEADKLFKSCLDGYLTDGHEVTPEIREWQKRYRKGK